MAVPKKIVVIGPESTGKSTLCEMLSERMGGPWVREYARGYCEKLDRPYTIDDLRQIAIGQLAAEENESKQTSPFLICDTDLYVLKVWAENTFDKCPIPILNAIATRQYDFYILTNVDTPWQPDPLREHSDPVLRQYFFNQYQDILIHSGVAWMVVSGNPEERLSMAVHAISKHFQLTF